MFKLLARLVDKSFNNSDLVASRSRQRFPKFWSFCQPAILLSLLTLTACGLTSQGDLLRDAIATQGREAAATALSNLEFTLCRAMPIGALRDRYGHSEALAEAWQTLCSNGDANLIGVEE